MTVHLLKMCVGVSAVQQLVDWQAMRREQKLAAGTEPVNIHNTRNRPRREAEVLDGGSLYWIIKGQIRVRQRILRLDQTTDDHGRRYCGLVLDQDLVRTELRPARPMQGWRYLATENAPSDIGTALGDDDLPEHMQSVLRALGLL